MNMDEPCNGTESIHPPTLAGALRAALGQGANMTNADIIKLARQHGKPVQEQNADEEYLFSLEGVAALLASEREACADICDQHASIEGIAQRCAAAIRARSKT